MVCRLGGANLLSELVIEYCWEQTSMQFKSKFIHFHSRQFIWKCRLEILLGVNVLAVPFRIYDYINQNAVINVIYFFFQYFIVLI